MQWRYHTVPNKYICRRYHIIGKGRRRKNCIKPLVLGTSLASHTHKLSVSTAETSFCLILEPQSPFFFQPPVWDKFNLQFGTQFISISLDFHSYLFISTGQIVVQGVACWSTSAYFDNVSGINKQWIQSIIKVHPTRSASHHSLPNLFIFFVFREQSQGHYHIVCYNCVSAVIQIRELWSTTVMASDRLLKSRMTEPGGVQNPILLARRAAVIDKYEGLKSSYPELPSYIRDFQVSCSHFVCLRKSITHPFQS